MLRTKASSFASEPLTLKKAASTLCVAPSTIHRSLNDGIIPGEQLTPGAPWRIQLTDELIARFNNDAGKGFMPMRETMRALGVSHKPCYNDGSAASRKPVMARQGDNQAIRTLRSKSMKSAQDEVRSK
jgi:hypothetical protein